MIKLVNYSIKIGISIFLIFIFFVFSAFWYFSAGLPDYKKLSNYQPPISSRVYSEYSNLIAEYAIEKRLFIPYESIPGWLKKFLSSADRNEFITLSGIDSKGMNNLFSIAYSAINLLSSEYTLLDIGG